MRGAVVLVGLMLSAQIALAQPPSPSRIDECNEAVEKCEERLRLGVLLTPEEIFETEIVEESPSIGTSAWVLMGIGSAALTAAAVVAAILVAGQRSDPVPLPLGDLGALDR
jgi:hypothetical protein